MNGDVNGELNGDVIVVGLGAVGSAAAWQLARRGARVIGLDRFAPPHDRGSSHGLTRVTREAVGEGEAYAPLVRRSHAIWRELEAELAGTLEGPLMTATGVLVIGPAGVETSFVARTAAVARAFGVPHERLDAAELRRRWPMFSVGDDEAACFEPGGGVVFPERCIAAQLAMAQRAGAVLRSDEPVLSLAPQGSGWVVQTAHGTHHAAQVLVTAGAWLPGLAAAHGLAWAQPLRVLRQTLHWLAPEPGQEYLFAPGHLPTFIATRGDRYEDTFYGMPMLDGTGGLKVGTEQFEAETQPDTVQREVAATETAALFERLVKPRLAGLTGRAVRGSACLYTMAADGRFRIARSASGLTWVSACSGHGFKHSAALGEALAEQLLHGASALDLSAFTPGPGAHSP
jgi:sarcosine oxidase